MIRLQILSGRKAGTVFDGLKPPVTLGRADNSDVLLDDPGVWPAHGAIQWRNEGLVLEVEPNALASVNSAAAQKAPLRNGDVLMVGGVNLRFGFSPVQQSSAALREWLTWIGLAALCLFQVAVIYWVNG